MWPYVIQTDSLVLPTYIVVNSFVFSLGVVWIFLRAGKFGFNQNRMLDLTLFAMLGGFVGARGFHILFEMPKFYWRHPDFIFKFWNGGFVYYGGAFGATLAAWVYCLVKKFDFLKAGDLMAPVLAGGYAIGRLGCLAAGCCYGSLTTMPWGISFPEGVEAPAGVKIHPTQIYSSLWETLVLIVLLYCERRHKLHGRGQLFGLWLLLHGLGRALVEQFRGDFRGWEPLNLSISTWISAVIMIAGVWLVATANPGPGDEIKRHASTTV